MPLPDLAACSEIIIPHANERYKIERDEHYYTLYIWMEDKGWFSFYCFEYPLRYITFEEAQLLYSNYMSHLGVVKMRDYMLKIGKVTENGRIGYNVDFSDECNTFAMFVDRGKVRKIAYDNSADGLDQMQLDIETNIGLSVPSFASLSPVVPS